MCGENEPENSGRIDRRRKIGRSGIREAVFGRSGMGHKDDGRSGRRDSALYFMP